MSDRQPESVVHAAPARKGTIRGRRILILAVMLIGSYLLAAYVLMPLGWRRYVSRHPALEAIPRITHTGSGIPGDPLNVAIVGTQDQMITVLLAAKWLPADPLSVRSSLKIAADTVFRRPYVEAPVSSLYLFGRKEDFAFELPVGDDPKKRNHVRLWRANSPAPDGRPVWVGSATFDIGVGFSHTTGEITHHVAPDIDTERDRLIQDLKRTGDLEEVFWKDDFHLEHEGTNGGGDPWRTDGRLAVAVIAPGLEPPPEH